MIRELMTFYQNVGELILGTRLKRLSDRLLTDISKIYKSKEIPFEPSWFPVFYLLDNKEKLSVSELAQITGITQSGASQMVTLLVRKGLIEYSHDEADKRVRYFSFTPEGLSLLGDIKPVWKSLKASIHSLLSENESSALLFSALAEFEDSMETKSVYSRVIENLNKTESHEASYLNYNDTHEEQYRDLVLTWLSENEHNPVTKDVAWINSPSNWIEAGNGAILTAKIDDDIIGVTVVAFNGESNGRLLLYFVKHDWRRLEIGRQLLIHSISAVEKNDIKKLTVQLGRKHIHAIKLFKEVGFTLQSVLQPNERNEINTLITLSLDMIKENSAENLNV